MGSPPKPWERSGSIAAASSPSPLSTVSTSSSAPAASVPISASTTTTSASTTNPPSVPARPASFASPVASTTPSPFTSPYSNPYNRFGTTSSYSPYGSSLYGSVGSLGGYGGYPYGGYGMNSMYGGSYGSMGMGMGGMGGMGMYGQPGMPFDPSNPSVTQALESTTATTFALLHSVVQTFAGLAQMLESTFMATHSSFFALAGVVDQFAQLRQCPRQRAWPLRSRPLASRSCSPAATAAHAARCAASSASSSMGGPCRAPRPPRRTRARSRSCFSSSPCSASPTQCTNSSSSSPSAPRGQQQQHPQQQGILMPGGQVLPPLDPSQLSFARTVYPFQASTPSELNLQENEIVAIMGKLDPNTGMEVDPRMEVETEWWKGRTREGREGWFPRKFVEVLERKALEAKKVD
ncbi:Peroxin 13, N-terminal region-domain-containing protein [Lactarius vividus]|nr:Peroxin 13, N-terminal region-domain-containing protein [Lactarius vividus]